MKVCAVGLDIEILGDRSDKTNFLPHKSLVSNATIDFLAGHSKGLFFGKGSEDSDSHTESLNKVLNIMINE